MIHVSVNHVKRFVIRRKGIKQMENKFYLMKKNNFHQTNMARAAELLIFCLRLILYFLLNSLYHTSNIYDA